MVDLHDFAKSKLVAVLGQKRGADVLADLLRSLHLVRIDTADDLERVAKELRRLDVVEQSLGALFASRATLLRIRGH